MILTEPEEDRLAYSLGAMVSGDIMRRCSAANDKDSLGFVFKGILELHGVHYRSGECILISNDELSSNGVLRRPTIPGIWG